MFARYGAQSQLGSSVVIIPRACKLRPGSHLIRQFLRFKPPRRSDSCTDRFGIIGHV